VGNEHKFEIDPVGIDTIIDAFIRFNPIAIDITRIRLLSTEASVNVDFSNPGPQKLSTATRSPLNNH
jgi:hypothetical protein